MTSTPPPWAKTLVAMAYPPAGRCLLVHLSNRAVAASGDLHHADG